MKKILALVLAIVMIASMSVVASAAETFTGDANIGSTDLVYECKEGYVVTIPGDLEFTAQKLTIDDAEVVASDVRIAFDKKLEVYVSSATVIDGDVAKAAWTLGDLNDISEDVVYTASATTLEGDYTTAGTVDLVDANGQSPFLVVALTAGQTTAGEGTAELTFATAGTAQVGNYKDILTFTTVIAAK